MQYLKFIFILFFISLTGVKMFGQTAADYYKQGLYYDSRDVLIRPIAAKNYLNAIMLDSSKAEYHNGFGNVLLKEKLYEYSIPFFTKAIAINPTYADAYANRGEAYFDMFNFAAALEDFEKAYTYQTNKNLRDYYKSYYIRLANDGLKKDKKPYVMPNYLKYDVRCLAIYLEEKWLKLSLNQLYQTANQSQFVMTPEKEQWAKKDVQEIKKIKPYSRLNAEHCYLEAGAVIYYLEIMNKGKSKAIQQDSIAHYIHKKTNQGFYAAAILYRHYLNDTRGFGSEGLLAKCNAERANGLKKLLPYLTALDKEPGNYKQELANMPGIARPWMDQANTIVKAPPRYDPTKVADASCAEKLQMVGYVYSSPLPMKYDKFYVLQFDCATNSFLVLRTNVYILPYGAKKSIMQIPAMVWLKEPDFRVGYKDKQKLLGKNYRICDKCNGRGSVEVTTSSGASYTQLNTDYRNPQNNTYKKHDNGGKVSTFQGKCGRCEFAGWLAD